jgi:hypothetical protein
MRGGPSPKSLALCQTNQTKEKLMQNEMKEEPRRSAKTPTKVYRLQIDQTRTYFMTVAAESAEQATAAWEATGGLEYSALFRPD